MEVKIINAYPSIRKVMLSTMVWYRRERPIVSSLLWLVPVLVRPVATDSLVDSRCNSLLFSVQRIKKLV